MKYIFGISSINLEEIRKSWICLTFLDEKFIKGVLEYYWSSLVLKCIFVKSASSVKM